MFFTIAFVTISTIYSFHYKYVVIGVMIGYDSFEVLAWDIFYKQIF